MAAAAVSKRVQKIPAPYGQGRGYYSTLYHPVSTVKPSSEASIKARLITLPHVLFLIETETPE